jgi:HK97 family phage portal protein
MSLFASRSLGDTPNELVPVREGRSPLAPSMQAGGDLRISAVWAALRLRSNLISSLPVGAFRTTAGITTAMPMPPILTSPGSLLVGGPPARCDEWLAATQMDLDRYGNAFGLITGYNSWGKPSGIDLVPASDVRVRARKGVLTYHIGGEKFDKNEVWHERQYVVTGLPIGLSPVAYAALTLGQYASAQEFARTWFNAGVIPSAVMKNNQRTLTDTQSDTIKQRVKSTLSAGDVLVVGKDWEWDMVDVPSAQKQFLEAMEASNSDIARFFDVPGDLIDIAVSGQNVTYANLTQRNLQLLIMHIGPAVQRREAALSTLLPSPQTVGLNEKALLRMDPAALTTMLLDQVKGRALTPSEWRQMENRPPLTPADLDEFAALFPIQSDAKKETA